MLKKQFKLLSTIACALILSITAIQNSFAGEMRQILTLDMAKKMADACEAKKNSNPEWRKINVAIVDSGGNLVLFRRQTDAFMGSINIAISKAQSAARIPVPTRTIAEIVYGKDGKSGRNPGLVHAGVVAFAGGMPIRNSSGHMLGAIGVSGATSDQDEECAKAGLEAISSQLR